MAVVSGVGTLVVIVLVGLATYAVARHFLVAQRESTALSQAYADAAYISVGLQTAGVNVKDLLSQQAHSERELLLRSNGRWYSTSVSQGVAVLPDDVASAVRGGDVAYAWTSTGSQSALVVGIPLVAVGGEFYEVVRTPALSATLLTFQRVLSGFALVGGVLGAAFGRLLAAQVLRPLRRIAQRAALVREGTPSSRLGTTNDPDLKPIVDSLNAMTDALQARRRRDAQFAVDAAHELRSPLMTLTTSLKLVRNRRAELPPTARTAVDLMGKEVDRLRHTVEDLLELGRLSERDGTPSCAWVDPVELARETLRMSGRSTALLDAPCGQGLAELDKGRVARALINLLDNADLHGGGTQSLRVRVSPDHVRFEVQDAGLGVPVEERERIFERFSRGARTARQGRMGSGLGLSIVTEIAVAHQGSVRVESPGEGGALFLLELARRQVGGAPSQPGDLGDQAATDRAAIPWEDGWADGARDR